MPEPDQAATGEGTESQEAQETQETQVDNQATSQEGQSDEGKSEEQELFKLPDGREVDVNTLSKEWKEKFYPEFTKRSQKLREYERKEQDRKKESEATARKGIEEDEALKNVPPDVKEAIVKIVTPVIDSRVKAVEQQKAKQDRDKQFEQQLQSLEEKYPGGDGKPKFDRNEVLEAMRDSDNQVFDPELKFEQLHREKFNDLLIKKALKQKKGGAKTEKTGSGPKKPKRKTPKSFKEARASLKERVKASKR